MKAKKPRIINNEIGDIQWTLKKDDEIDTYSLIYDNFEAHVTLGKANGNYNIMALLTREHEKILFLQRNKLLNYFEGEQEVRHTQSMIEDLIDKWYKPEFGYSPAFN